MLEPRDGPLVDVAANPDGDYRENDGDRDDNQGPIGNVFAVR